ncbi:thrombospondin type-1 domain-containing protein 7b [Plakobranchus ocellatus]|uniref:Thrombospondin type-1 domain-containing protein 7b n=1 Tax=Plakobranchus ocellatus TaxID=259542 RepID=A0AAV4BN97_9GAST|nr:thrombospondin type-1 domain-containing protein 7b [Plakobranchus ocellatus]
MSLIEMKLKMSVIFNVYFHVRLLRPCDERNRPASKLQCVNPVCVAPAVCRDTNTCECAKEVGPGHVIQRINATAVTCAMNGTGLAEDAGSSKVAKSPNIWMYAVIAVGTLFVIAVTAALYNMCELFRTGPRPRRKGQASTTASSANSMHSLHHQQQQQQLQQRRQQQIDGKVGSLDEIDESTTLVDCGMGVADPACPGNGTVAARGENLYKQIDRGRVRGVAEGGGGGGAEGLSESSRGLLHNQPEGNKILPRDSRSPFVIVSTNPGSSRSSPGFSSSSHRRYSQPSPEPPHIYNNCSSPLQVSGEPSIARPAPRAAQEFRPQDIPDLDDPSSPTSSSTSAPTVVTTTTNTTNSGTTPSTPGYSNISVGKAVAPASNSNFPDNGGKNISSSKYSRANGPSQVSTISRDELNSASVALRPNQLSRQQRSSDTPNQPQSGKQPQQARPNLKRNRRYRRIHRMLPSRMVQCLVRDDDPEGISSDDACENDQGDGRREYSQRMTAPQNTNPREVKVRSLDRHDRGVNQGMRLTPAHGIEQLGEGDYVEGLRQTTPGSGYRPSPSPSSSYRDSLLLHEHACMLPPPPPPAPITPSSSHELHQVNFDPNPTSRHNPEVVLRAPRSPLRTNSSHGDQAGIELKASGPRTSYSFLHTPRSAHPSNGHLQNDPHWPNDPQYGQGQVPSAAKAPLLSKKPVARTPSCASSDSVPLSALTDHMIASLNHPENSVGAESCSQCSLQLGDTAETLLQDDTRVHTDRRLDSQLLQTSIDRDSLPTVPEIEDAHKHGAHGYGRPRHPGTNTGGRTRDGLSVSPPLPQPPPPPAPPQTEPLVLDLDPSSSFLLSSCSPDLKRLLQPALASNSLGSSLDQGNPTAYNKPKSVYSTQSAALKRGADVGSGYSSPLHVSVADSGRGGSPLYPANTEHPQVHNKRAKQSAPSPQSFYSDTQVPAGQQKPSHPGRSDARFKPHSHSPSPTAGDLPANQRRAGRNWGEPKISPAPESVPYAARSSASLPAKLPVSANHAERLPPNSPRQLSFLPADKTVRGTSEDSGRSTLPHSPSVSPRGQQQQQYRSNPLYDLGSNLTTDPKRRESKSPARPTSGAFTPILVTQASTESGHDSPTPSVCDQCQREMELSRGDFYLSPSATSTPRTPRSRSQMSDLSGVETSV